MVESCVGLTIYVTDASLSWFRDGFTSRGFICLWTPARIYVFIIYSCISAWLINNILIVDIGLANKMRCYLAV